jgi:hypothetical protein
MRETTTNPRFSAALHRMEEVHNAKSHDYATDDNRYANFEFAEALVERFGDPHDQVFATMVGIKIARLGELLGRGKTPKHESIDDSFLDLANYAVLWWTSSQRRRGLADGAAGDERVAPTRTTLEQEAAQQPNPEFKVLDDARFQDWLREWNRQERPSNYINDGQGRLWLKCSPTCDLHLVRPGQVTCRCHGHSDDSI